MGTSGSYGGSGSANWQNARQGFDGLGGGGGAGGDSGPDAPPDGQALAVDAAAAAVAAAIAAALLAEDPQARRPTSSVPLSTLLSPSRGGGGGSGGGTTGRSGTHGRAGGGSRRQVMSGARRGGAALGGAYALRNGDAAGLRELGLDLGELSQLSPRVQLARIIDATIGEAGHPDDYALKRATIEHLKTVLLANTPPPPEVSIRNFVAEWIFQQSLVELQAARATRGRTQQQVDRAERQLRDWLKRRVQRIEISTQSRPSVQNLADITAKITGEALRLIKAGTT
jgi:hypothetical protein